MNRKLLSLLTVASFALFMSACGGDDKKNSVGPDITCEDTEDCLEDEDESSSSIAKSSSSKKTDAKSSSSVKEGKDEDKSSSSAKEDKDEDKSSSSEAKDDSSSSAEETADSSSSSEEVVDSSSSSEEAAESSSSEEVKPIEYASTTPNLADLEVSGDTLFAVFQRADESYNFIHNGLLALYKLSDGTLLDTIQLTTKNPSTVKVANGNVYVGTQGEYDALWNMPADDTRGLEKIDLENKKSSMFVGGSKLGGAVYEFIVNKADNIAYASILNVYGSSALVEINLSTGSVKKITGISDASGSLEFDEINNILYIGDRDGYNYEAIQVYKYSGSTLTPLSTPDEEEDEYEMRQPYSIKVVAGAPYVFWSDQYSGGGLILDYAADVNDYGIQFFQDSKLAVANNELFVMERGDAASIAKINTTDGSVIWQSVAVGKNPYDMVAASSTTAWVAYYGSPVLELINTSNGSTVKLIDTKEFCAVKIDGGSAE